MQVEIFCQRHLRSLTLFSLLGALLALSSCAGGGSGPQITKVGTYELKPGTVLRTPDPMIDFEQRYRLHGAIENPEYLEKYGEYITVFWSVPRGTSDVTLRLDYRQQRTGPEVFTQEIPIAKVKRVGKNTTEFRITGQEYAEKGALLSWKASLVVNGEVVADKRSYLWKD